MSQFLEPKEDIPQLLLQVARATPESYTFFIIMETVITMWERIEQQQSNATAQKNEESKASSEDKSRFRQDVIYLADQVAKEASRFNLPAKEMQAIDEEDNSKGAS